MLGILPVPATPLVLFVVVAAVVPQLGQARGAVLAAIPFYIAFALLAPLSDGRSRDSLLCAVPRPAALLSALRPATRSWCCRSR